jgi:protein subunit release factor A
MVIDNIKKKTTELLNDPEIQPLTEQLKQIKAKSEEALKHMKIYEKYKKNMNNIKASTNVMKEYIDKAEIFLLNSQFRLRDFIKEPYMKLGLNMTREEVKQKNEKIKEYGKQLQKKYQEIETSAEKVRLILNSTLDFNKKQKEQIDNFLSNLKEKAKKKRNSRNCRKNK